MRAAYLIISARSQVITVHIEIQTILSKIDRAAALLLADHIEMPLNDDRLFLFIAFSGAAHDDDISERVLPTFQMMIPRKS